MWQEESSHHKCKVQFGCLQGQLQITKHALAFVLVVPLPRVPKLQVKTKRRRRTSVNSRRPKEPSVQKLPMGRPATLTVPAREMHGSCGCQHRTCSVACSGWRPSSLAKALVVTFISGKICGFDEPKAQDAGAFSRLVSLSWALQPLQPDTSRQRSLTPDRSQQSRIKSVS